jgi:hypothetical protein
VDESCDRRQRAATKLVLSCYLDKDRTGRCGNGWVRLGDRRVCDRQVIDFFCAVRPRSGPRARGRVS